MHSKKNRHTLTGREFSEKELENQEVVMELKQWGTYQDSQQDIGLIISSQVVVSASSLSKEQSFPSMVLFLELPLLDTSVVMQW